MIQNAQHSNNNILIQRTQLEQQNKKTNPDNPEIQQEEQEPSTSCLSLFRFATPLDVCLMIFGSIGAIAMGISMPSFALLWGNMTDSFGQGSDALVSASLSVMLQFIYVGVGAFFASWMMFACWMIAGQRQAIQCRKKYFESLLKQQIGWFDTFNQAQMASKFATNSFAFQGAIGEKVATAIMTVAMVLAGFVIGFIKGWLMAVVTISILPALAIASFIYMFIIQKKDTTMQKHYAQAGGVAEQAISSIKTIKQLNGQGYQIQKYEQLLDNSSKYICIFALFSGLGIGLIYLVMLCSYALGFWWGSVLIQDDYSNPVSSNGYYNTGDTIVIFFCILIGGFNIAQLFPSIEKIIKAKQAAARIYSVIDRQPLIVNLPDAKKPDNIKGIIKFENVSFSYPKDPTRKILDNINLEFDCKTTALVGQSGSGKSTILQLIMRFYDPDQGKITLDGIDIKQLDLHWLRTHVGYVGQEPVLFAISIRQNLLFGKQNASEQEMIDALVKAQAYQFVKTLEKGLDTYVGSGGGQLSGGQKQRIAIARAILKNPQILLLDEATSALDRRNEKLIQQTLNKISSSRTTISVAHRVRTIASSNIIYVLDKGKIVQTGTFQTLPRFKDMQQEQQEISPLNPKITIVEGNKAEQEQRPEEDTKESVQQMTQEEKAKKQQEELVQKYQWSAFCRLAKYGLDKIVLTIIGVIAAIINGTVFPFFAMLFGKLLAVLINLETKHTPQDRSNANFYSYMFVVLGGISFIANLFQILIFNYVGQSITRKIRAETYTKIMKMPIPWFDIPRNNAGSLNARLATDCQLVNGLVTTLIAIMIQNISTLVTGLAIAFYYQWRISLVALGLIPLLIIAGILQVAVQTGFSDQSDKAYKDSSNLIMESTVNIRTVCSFGNEKVFLQQYSVMLDGPYYVGIKKGNLAGMLYGVSQFSMFLVIGLLFYLGSIFVRDFGVSISDLFSAIYAIIFSAMTAGNNFHFMPDAGQGLNSAANIFSTLDSEDEYEKQQKENSKMIKEKGNGKIEFKNITFKYETRKDEVFKNFTLSIDQGQKMAFVGASGCGKSTLLQLILRFYEPSEGQITIDGINIKDFDLQYLRSRFGVVSQQPVLFNGSFADNIRYNKKDATMEQIQYAAKQANATSFILGEEKLMEQQKKKKKKKKEDDQEQGTKKIFQIDEDDIEEIGKDKTGFDKGVGIKGSHISGGQKQRVAIARAILRNPHILLLDQATSALDSMNEQKVQQSLDKIMKDKTTISIAHRIDTIKNSDKIFVFQKGKVVQEGTYENLKNIKGYFYNLERGTEFI